MAKPKKKLKTGETNSKYNLRFVPVDPIKHAPSIITASIETAALASQDFSLEFCAREKSLPYAKMIHSRMLLGAIDFNLQQVDIKAVFLLAEATICVLRTIICKLVSRSKFRSKLRSEEAYEEFKKKSNLSEDRILNSHRARSNKNVSSQFEIDDKLMEKLKTEISQNYEFIQNDSENETDQSLNEENEEDEDLEDKKELRKFSNDLINNKLKTPVKQLPITLFDLKNLLQVGLSNFVMINNLIFFFQ